MHGVSWPTGMCNLPGPGISPVSPALAGGCSPTGPPRSPRSNCIFDLRLLGSSLCWYKSPLGCWGRPVRGCGRFQGGGITEWDPFARAPPPTHTQSGTEIYTRQNFIDVGLPGEGVCGPQGRACSTIMGVAWMTGSPWGRQGREWVGSSQLCLPPLAGLVGGRVSGRWC